MNLIYKRNLFLKTGLYSVNCQVILTCSGLCFLAQNMTSPFWYPFSSACVSFDNLHSHVTFGSRQDSLVDKLKSFWNHAFTIIWKCINAERRDLEKIHLSLE